MISLITKKGDIPVVALGACCKQILRAEGVRTNCPADSCSTLEDIVPTFDLFVRLSVAFWMISGGEMEFHIKLYRGIGRSARQIPFRGRRLHVRNSVLRKDMEYEQLGKLHRSVMCGPCVGIKIDCLESRSTILRAVKPNEGEVVQ